MKKILITGATGYIASLILPIFRKSYELNLVDNRIKDKNNKKVPDIKLCDLISTNFRDSEEYFKGVDTVIHLAYKGSSKGGVWDKESPFIDRFSVEHENILMANNVYRAAYENGVKRVVVASSNHAAHWYEHSQIHLLCPFLLYLLSSSV